MKVFYYLIVFLFLTACNHSTDETADSYINKAQILIKKNQIKLASTQLKNALLLEKNNKQARLMLAQVNLKLGDFIAAERDFNFIQNTAMASFHWQNDYAIVLLKQEKYQILLDKVKIDPTNNAQQRASINAVRGHAWLLLNHLKEAKTSFKQALQLNSNNIFAVLGNASLKEQANEFNLAIQILTDFLIKHPNASTILVKRGFLYQNQQQYEKALVDFEQVLKKEQNNINALIGKIYAEIALFTSNKTIVEIEKIKNKKQIPYLTALTAFQNHDIKQAQQKLKIILNKNPAHKEAQLLFATANMLMHNNELAAEYLRRLVFDKSKNKTIRLLLAILYLNENELENAQRILQYLYQKYPHNIEFEQLLGAILIADNQLEKANLFLKKALKHHHEHPQLQFLSLISQQLQGNNKASIKQLEKISFEENMNKIDTKLFYIQALLKNNQAEFALKQLQKMELSSPNQAFIHNLRGLVYSQQKAWQSAQQSFQKALKLTPHFYAAQINLIKLLILQGKQQKALELTEKFLIKAPKYLGLILVKFELLIELHKNEKAQQFLTHIYQKQPKNQHIMRTLVQYYIKMDKFKEAVSLLQQFLGNTNKDAENLLMLGKVYQYQKKSFKAADIFRKVILLRPKQSEAYLLLTQIQIKQDKIYQAKINLHKATAYTYKDNLNLLKTQADILKRTNRYNEALKIAQIIQKKWQNQAQGFQIEAQILVTMGLYKKAILSYQKALQKDNVNNKITADFILLLLSQNQQQKAQVLLTKALLLNPQDLQLLMVKAIILQQQKKWQEAFEINKKIIESYSDNAIILNNMAWLLYQQDKLKKALKYAKKAQKFAPQNPHIMDTYGWLLAKTGNPVVGGVLLEKAHYTKPEDPEIFLHMALIWFERGVDESAIKASQQIKKNFPNTEYARQASALLLKIKHK